MRSTRQLSITLPAAMANMVRRKVSSGEYASESEVLRDGLRALRARDQAIENWLRNEVVPAYDAFKADPSQAISASAVRRTIDKLHARTKKARR